MVFKKHFSVILTIVALFILVSAAPAQLKLGYVDSQRILSANAAAQDASKKLETESNRWTQELQKMEQDIKTKMESLDQQSLLLSEEKKQERMQELQNMQIEAQKYQNDKWGENGEAYQLREQLLKPVIDAINTAIHKVGQDGGYDFIFDTVNGNVLYAQDKYDLTELVIEELGKAKTTGQTQ
jgi:outer membrane protein